MLPSHLKGLCLTSLLSLALTGCHAPHPSAGERYLYTADYMADPSGHCFEGRLYIYPSHDRDSEVKDPSDGNHYDMVDYHVLTLDDPACGEARDLGCALRLEEVPWATKQLWAPDAACKEGRYYLYFGAKDSLGIFRIGVASSDRPEGPFRAEPQPIEGSYSIDPTVIRDGEEYYLCFGGLQGGQLQRWRENQLLDTDCYAKAGEAALPPRIARLSEDMCSLAEPSRPIEILDAEGNPLKEGDPHRFFEGLWMHRHDETWYLSYSTGTTHRICYATGESPYGPFTWRGVLLEPVAGWTTHHSIVEYDGGWWMLFHDAARSGESRLRNLKICPLRHESDGRLTLLRNPA